MPTIPESAIMPMGAPQMQFVPQAQINAPTSPNAGQLLGKAIGDVVDVGLAFQHAQRAADYSRAKADIFKKKTEFLINLENDPEARDNPASIPQKWGEFKGSVMEEARTMAGEDQNLAAALSTHLTTEFARDDIGVTSLHRKRVVDMGVASLDNEVGGYLSAMPAARTEEEFMGLEMKARQAVTLAERSGFLTRDKGEGVIRDFLMKRDDFRARRDIREKPSETLAALTGDPESYSGVNTNPSHRLMLIRAANERIDELRREEEHRVRLAEHQEARAERNLRQYQARNEDLAFAEGIEGTMTVEKLVAGLRTQRYTKAGVSAIMALMERGDRAAYKTPESVIRTFEIDNVQELNEAFTAGEIDATMYRQRRKELGSEENGEYRDAKDLLSKVFKQGENSFDKSYQERYAVALEDVQRTFHAPDGGGKKAYARALELANREKTATARPMGYTGAMTIQGLESHKAALVREFQAGPQDENAKRKLNSQIRMIDNSISRLSDLQDIPKGAADEF